MISHRHQFIFVHIPKTAGTTIRAAFYREYDELHNPHHAGISKIKESLSEEVFQSYFKFGAVRNPWDREVSRYTYIKEEFRHIDNDYCQNGFKEYLYTFSQRPNALNYNEIRVGGEISLNYIIKFENLQEDFNTACDKIGIPHRKLSHTNKSKHKHYTEYYDDETKQIVAKKYAKDIEHFGYKFGE